ncbi:MAG: radical SAM protein [Euryarchaeota archaeon]|nr:radical SAM protein [Euryarchaeota archaeon]
MHVRPFGAGSLYTRLLPMGCRHCKRGSKMVLFITGRCEMSCLYCPLSAAKKNKDVTYANELRTDDENEVLAEAELIRATGTGITGGDPLFVPDRTLRYIKLLKRHFGEGHHIHLYTSTVDPDLYRELAKAGLDELRLHPMVKDWKDLGSLKIAEAASELDIPFGFEVPMIPGLMSETRSLIGYASDNVFDFVNLNELEFSETNASRLKERGFAVKNDISAAVKGSEELAVVLALDGSFKVPVHYCSSSFKDKVQLRNRIVRRARSVAEAYDLVTPEGMIVKGAVETEDPKAVIEMLKGMDVPADMFRYDDVKKRVEVAPWILREIAGDLPWCAYQVEEYPTADRLEVEREPLNRRKVKIKK